MTNAQLARPRFPAKSNAVYLDPAHRGAAVHLLLVASRPPNITRCIATIVVDAVELRTGEWRVPHVGDEVRKRVPAFTHCDAASAVTRPVFVVRVVATAFHSAPATITRWLLV